MVVEGNYLLLDDPSPWDQVKENLDLAVFLRVDLDEAKERVARRHMEAWGWDYAQAIDRASGPDYENMKLVSETADRADLVVDSVPWKDPVDSPPASKRAAVGLAAKANKNT